MKLVFSCFLLISRTYFSELRTFVRDNRASNLLKRKLMKEYYRCRFSQFSVQFYILRDLLYVHCSQRKAGKEIEIKSSIFRAFWTDLRWVKTYKLVIRTFIKHNPMIVKNIFLYYLKLKQLHLIFFRNKIKKLNICQI